MLDEIEHVLIVEQPDEMKRTEAGRTAEGQVTNHHRTEVQNRREKLKRGEVYRAFFLPSYNILVLFVGINFSDLNEVLNLAI